MQKVREKAVRPTAAVRAETNIAFGGRLHATRPQHHTGVPTATHPPTVLPPLTNTTMGTAGERNPRKMYDKGKILKYRITTRAI